MEKDIQILLQKCKPNSKTYKIHREGQPGKTKVNTGRVFIRKRNLMEYLGYDKLMELLLIRQNVFLISWTFIESRLYSPIETCLHFYRAVRAMFVMFELREACRVKGLFA